MPLNWSPQPLGHEKTLAILCDTSHLELKMFKEQHYIIRAWGFLKLFVDRRGVVSLSSQNQSQKDPIKL
jgi:hypothetical protein